MSSEDHTYRGEHDMYSDGESDFIGDDELQSSSGGSSGSKLKMLLGVGALAAVIALIAAFTCGGKTEEENSDADSDGVIGSFITPTEEPVANTSSSSGGMGCCCLVAIISGGLALATGITVLVMYFMECCCFAGEKGECVAKVATNSEHMDTCKKHTDKKKLCEEEKGKEGKNPICNWKAAASGSKCVNPNDINDKKCIDKKQDDCEKTESSTTSVKCAWVTHQGCCEYEEADFDAKNTCYTIGSSTTSGTKTSGPSQRPLKISEVSAAETACNEKKAKGDKKCKWNKTANRTGNFICKAPEKEKPKSTP